MTNHEMSMDRRRVAYILLCEAAAQQGNGKGSFIGVFDRIHVDKFPAQHAGVTLVARVNGTPGQPEQIRLFYRDSQGNDMMPPLGPLKINYSAYGTATVQVNIQGLPLRKHGIFDIGVEADGKRLGYTTLYVEPTSKGKP